MNAALNGEEAVLGGEPRQSAAANPEITRDQLKV